VVKHRTKCNYLFHLLKIQLRSIPTGDYKRQLILIIIILTIDIIPCRYMFHMQLPFLTWPRAGLVGPVSV